MKSYVAFLSSEVVTSQFFEAVKLTVSLLVTLLRDTQTQVIYTFLIFLSLITSLFCILIAQAFIACSKIMF